MWLQKRKCVVYTAVSCRLCAPKINSAIARGLTAHVSTLAPHGTPRRSRRSLKFWTAWHLHRGRQTHQCESRYWTGTFHFMYSFSNVRLVWWLLFARVATPRFVISEGRQLHLLCRCFALLRAKLAVDIFEKHAILCAGTKTTVSQPWARWKQAPSHLE